MPHRTVIREGKMTRLNPLALPLFALLCACGDDDPPSQGTLRVVVRAEPTSFALTTSDDWEVQFEKLAVSVREVKLAGLALSNSRELDFTAAPGTVLELGEGMVSSGQHTHAAFTMERLVIAGTASKEGVSKHFDWQLEQPTEYVRCANQTRVAADESATLTLVVEPGQLFRNSIASAEPTLLFQAVADADRNDDGEVEGDELWEVPPIAGFDLGDERRISTFWEYMEALVKRVGHVDDDVQCEVERR